MTPFLHLAAIAAGAVMTAAPGEHPEPAADATKTLVALCREGKGEAAQEEAERLIAADKVLALAAVTRVLWDRDLPCRNWVLNAVYRGRLKTAVPLLIALQDDPDPRVRVSAAGTLGVLGDEAAVAPLERRLKAETDPGDRHRIRVSLAQLGRPYLGYFLDGLRDRDPARRRECIFALRQLKDARSVSALIQLINESDTGESRDVAAALEVITEVPAITVIETTHDSKGRPVISGRVRLPMDIKNDNEAWVARNRDTVNRPVPPSAEKWEYTPEPHLPGLGVSFVMTPADVRTVLDKAGVKYTYHPARREQTGGGNTTLHSERIAADESLLKPFNVGMSDLVYLFRGGRLDEIRFTHHRHPDRAFTALMKPLRLRQDGPVWTGLDGTIKITELAGDSEKAHYSLTLNLHPR